MLEIAMEYDTETTSPVEEKTKFEPFRIKVKMAAKDAPIFPLDNDPKEHKMQVERRVILMKPRADGVENDHYGGTLVVEKGNHGDGTEECDILEVNAELDSCIEKDEEGPTAEEKKSDGGNEDQPKKHKKNDKREKKKKRRKEKSDEDTQENRHKKHRHERRTRKDSESHSSTSTGKRRNRSESSEKTRNRARDRSRDRHGGRNSSRGDNWRYSPSRFGTRRGRSRSRSPPITELVGQHGSSRSLSPRRQKSPRKKSTGEKTPRDKTPRGKTPRDKNPGGKSPRRESSPGEDKHHGTKSPMDKSSGDRMKKTFQAIKSPRTKSPIEKSSRKISPPSDGEVFSRKNLQPADTTCIGDDERSKPPRIVDYSSDVVSPGRESPAKSPVNSVPPRKSPLESPRTNTAGDVPVGVVVPYVNEDMSISETDNAASATGLEAASVQADQSKDVYKGIIGEEKKKKKQKGKQKEKRTNEEKKARKKKRKALATADPIDDHHDDLEDLLFTKTKKEVKYEDVFHDTDHVITAKHALRTAVIDVDPKHTTRKPINKKPMTTHNDDTQLHTEPAECRDISSPVPSPSAAEFYEPDEPTQSPVSPLEPPPTPPAIPGIFPTIPFLATPEGSPDETNDVTPAVGGDDAVVGAPYSPLEHPVLDYDSSPENHSTMRLSDISTKESTVAGTVGVISRKEKVEDFLGRMPGSFPQHTEAVVDMDMSSPTNGVNADDSDDDIIEQLHKEFVRAQNKTKPAEEDSPVEEETSWRSDMYEPGLIASPQEQDEEPSSSHDPEDIDRILGIVGIKSNRRKHKSSKKHGGGGGHHKVKPFAKEKKEIEDALNRVHRQARVEDEMKLVLKTYFKHKDITKEEYKMILRKAVPQVTNSNHGIDPERIRSLVKKYVAKYKGQRLRNEHNADNSLTKEPYSPNLSQDLPMTFSP